MLLVTAAFALAAPAALAAPGDPPVGMTPIAGSVYKGQFALCSLTTLTALSRTLGLDTTKLTPRAAAARLAAARERSLGTAASTGCRDGLLYRFRTDRAITSLRTSYNDRVTAEKYVIAVYLLIVAGFFAYVLIHAARVSRLTRAVEELRLALPEPGSEPGGSRLG